MGPAFRVSPIPSCSTGVVAGFGEGDLSTQQHSVLKRALSSYTQAQHTKYFCSVILTLLASLFRPAAPVSLSGTQSRECQIPTSPTHEHGQCSMSVAYRCLCRTSPALKANFSATQRICLLISTHETGCAVTSWKFAQLQLYAYSPRVTSTRSNVFRARRSDTQDRTDR